MPSLERKTRHVVALLWRVYLIRFIYFRESDSSERPSQCQSSARLPGSRRRWKFWEIQKWNFISFTIKCLQIFFVVACSTIMSQDQRPSQKTDFRGGKGSDAKSFNWYSFQCWSQPFNTTQTESRSRKALKEKSKKDWACIHVFHWDRTLARFPLWSGSLGQARTRLPHSGVQRNTPSDTAERPNVILEWENDSIQQHRMSQICSAQLSDW